MNITKVFVEGRCATKRCPDDAVGHVDGLCFDREDKVPLCERHMAEAIATFKLYEVPDSCSFIDGRALTKPKEQAPVQPQAKPPAPAHSNGAIVVSKEEQEALAQEAREANDVLTLAREMKIVTQADLEYAAEVLAEAKGRAKALDDKRKQLTTPLNAALKSVNDWFRPALTYYATVEKELKSRIAEATLRQGAQNQAALNAAALAVENGEDPSAALAQVTHIGNVQGVSTRETLDYEITDESLIPREYLVPDEKKIRAAINDEKNVPGVRVFVVVKVASRSA